MDYDISSDIVNIMTSEYAIYANNLTTIWLDSYCPIPGKRYWGGGPAAVTFQLNIHSLCTSNQAACFLITGVLPYSHQLQAVLSDAS